MRSRKDVKENSLGKGNSGAESECTYSYVSNVRQWYHSHDTGSAVEELAVSYSKGGLLKLLLSIIKTIT